MSADRAVRVIVTRPAAQAADWVARLQGLGVHAVALPLIGITPLDDAAPLRAAWHTLASAEIVVFVSPNAVAHFFAARPPGAAWPAHTLAGSTGPGTSAALRDAGIPPALLTEPAADTPTFDTEALWARIASRAWAGRQAWVVRGEDGRDWLAETLRAHGATVRFVTAYRRQPPQPDAAALRLVDEALATPDTHLWLFSSSEAVGHLQALRPGADWSRSRAVASHPRIAQTARAAGFGRVDERPPAPEAVAALVAAA